MKSLLLSALVALWAIACLAGWITLGLTVLNTCEWWWLLGFWITGAVFVAPLITYYIMEG